MALTDVNIGIDIKKWQDNNKFMLSCKVVEYQNIQAEIFAFKHDPTTDIDYFSNVASTANLISLPKHQVTPGNYYYLENLVELEFDTAKEREDTLQLLIIDVQQLKENWCIVKDQVDTEFRIVI